jgi:hypothetical protein
MPITKLAAIIKEAPKKKKLYAVLIAVVLIIVVVIIIKALTSGTGDAYDIYQKAENDFHSAAEAQITVVTNLSLRSGNQQNSVRVDGKILRAGEGDKARLQAELTLDYFGEHLSKKLYYENGWLYQDFQELLLKRTSSWEEALALSQTSPLIIPREAVKTSIKRETAEGQSFSLILNGGEIENIMIARMEELEDMSGIESAETEYKDAELIIELDRKGSLKSRTLLFTAGVSKDGSLVELIYEQKLNISSLGKTPLTPPENLESYLPAPAPPV